MRPLYAVVRLSEVSAARRVVIYYGDGKFNLCILCCLFNGWCPLFGQSAFGGFTVHPINAQSGHSLGTNVCTLVQHSRTIMNKHIFDVVASG